MRARGREGLNSTEAWGEMLSEELLDLLGGFRAGLAHAGWRVAPAARVCRIWLDYGRSKVVRDGKALRGVADLWCRNIVRLDACNILAGHSQLDGREMAEDLGFGLSEGEWDRLWWEYLEHPEFGSLISDYGHEAGLEGAFHDMWRAESESEEALLVAADKVLWVTHQRGDLSALFVAGGRGTLDRIRDQV